MGICLNIESIGVPDHKVKKALLADAERFEMNSEYDWWCEPLYLMGHENNEDPVVGIPKVFLMGYGCITAEGADLTTVDPNEDAFMAARDILFMSEKLAEWSEKHGVDWKLKLEGENVGRIVGGQMGPEIKTYLNQMTAGVGVEIDDPLFEAKGDEISEKYASRNE